MLVDKLRRSWWSVTIWLAFEIAWSWVWGLRHLSLHMILYPEEEWFGCLELHAGLAKLTYIM